MSGHRVRRLLATLVAVAVLPALGGLAGCAPDGGAATQARTWQVDALFDDALNLPKGAPVKAAGVQIGKVESVTADDYRARVRMAVEQDTRLRRGSQFRLRYTTALGELYVDVTPAEQGKLLTDGAVVRDPETSTAPTVEDTLAQASLLINGGSLGQVGTIVDELNLALDGRVGASKRLLNRTDRFLAEALASTREIDRILDALVGASETLQRRRATLHRALRELRPAARVLQENTDDMVRLLRSTNRMAVTADGLVRRTRADLIVIVEELGPVLDEVLENRTPLVRGLDVLNDFALRIDRRVPTEYLNLYFVVHVGSLLTDPDLPGPTLPGTPGLPLPEVPDPTLPGLPRPSRSPGVPGVPLPGGGG